MKFIITNEKGGTGKSTLACLLAEYLNYIEKKVQLIDTDPIQTSQMWVNNCQQEGRKVSQNPAEFQVIDTAGSSGSALSWLAQADLILVPLRAHYADLQTTITWFTSLKKDWQTKIIFIPNYWQNTREQREGVKQLAEIVAEEKAGQITGPLANRPALYGVFLNGGKENFFSRKEAEEVRQIIQNILSDAKVSAK